MGDKPFIVYTDHEVLRTVVNSPHFSQRLANWLSFFAGNIISVEYKSERMIVVADTLSRRPDSKPTEHPNSADNHTTVAPVASVPSSTPFDDVKKAYAVKKISYV